MTHRLGCCLDPLPPPGGNRCRWLQSAPLRRCSVVNGDTLTCCVAQRQNVELVCKIANESRLLMTEGPRVTLVFATVAEF